MKQQQNKKSQADSRMQKSMPYLWFRVISIVKMSMIFKLKRAFNEATIRAPIHFSRN